MNSIINDVIRFFGDRKLPTLSFLRDEKMDGCVDGSSVGPPDGPTRSFPSSSPPPCPSPSLASSPPPSSPPPSCSRRERRFLCRHRIRSSSRSGPPPLFGAPGGAPRSAGKRLARWKRLFAALGAVGLSAVLAATSGATETTNGPESVVDVMDKWRTMSREERSKWANEHPPDSNWIEKMLIDDVARRQKDHDQREAMRGNKNGKDIVKNSRKQRKLSKKKNKGTDDRGPSEAGSILTPGPPKWVSDGDKEDSEKVRINVDFRSPANRMFEVELEADRRRRLLAGGESVDPLEQLRGPIQPGPTPYSLSSEEDMRLDRAKHRREVKGEKMNMIILKIVLKMGRSMDNDRDEQRCCWRAERSGVRVVSEHSENQFSDENRRCTT